MIILSDFNQEINAKILIQGQKFRNSMNGCLSKKGSVLGKDKDLFFFGPLELFCCASHRINRRSGR